MRIAQKPLHRSEETVKGLKETLKAQVTWERSLLLGIFLMFFALHFFITMGTGDDEFFIGALDRSGLWDFLVSRYNGWTSRVVIEAVEVVVIRSPLLFFLLDSLMYTLLIYGLWSFGSKIRDWKSLLLTTGLVLLIPKDAFSNAGWVTTNTNYLWALSLGLMTLFPLQKILSSKKIHWGMWLLTLPLLAYAANLEQMAVVLLAFNGLGLLYTLHQRRFVLPLWIHTALIGFMMGVVFLSPGMARRAQLETAGRLPRFGDLSILDKVELGFVSTMKDFILQPNGLLLVLSLFLFFGAFRMKKGTWVLSVALVPLAGSLGAYLLPDFMTYLHQGIGPYGSIGPYGDLWSLGILGALVFSLWKLLQGPMERFMVLLVLALGLLTRMILGFSPTVWDSGTRTFLIFYAAVAYAALVVYDAYRADVKSR